MSFLVHRGLEWSAVNRLLADENAAGLFLVLKAAHRYGMEGIAVHRLPIGFLHELKPVKTGLFKKAQEFLFRERAAQAFAPELLIHPHGRRRRLVADNVAHHNPAMVGQDPPHLTENLLFVG